MIVSDHSPCTPELKRRDTGDFMEAWGGISALQFSLPVMWTNFKARGFEFTDLTRLMCEAPAKLAGLEKRKGKLARALMPTSLSGTRMRRLPLIRNWSIIATSLRRIQDGRCMAASRPFMSGAG
jgi:hypothetical protein